MRAPRPLNCTSRKGTREATLTPPHVQPDRAGEPGGPAGRVHPGETPRAERKSTGLVGGAVPGLVRVELSLVANSCPSEHELPQRELHKRPQREQVER